jgi:orotidine-5'-phosphate decarboxylase
MTALQTRTFGEKLTEAMRRNDSLLCVGLDPDLARLPEEFRGWSDIAGAIVAFNAAVIAATADLVCAYKPNLGFYLAHGAAGIAALEATRRLIPPDIPAILDAKFGDIGSTAEGYAKAAFDAWGFDAVTVNPYLGKDALEPFLRRDGRGVIVLGKTSNPGSGDFQDLDVVGERTQSLAMTVADRVQAWDARWPAALGLVVGATYPGELADVRRRCPELPILLPGVGAQGGDLEASLRAGLNADRQGLIVTASRSVIYAGADLASGWIGAVRAAAESLRAEINAARMG